MRVMFGDEKPTEMNLVSPLVSTNVPLCLKFRLTGIVTNKAKTLGGMFCFYCMLQMNCIIILSEAPKKIVIF